MIRHFIVVGLFVPCAALASFSEGCSGKVGPAGSGSSSGSSQEVDSSSGVAASSSGLGSSSGVGSSSTSGSTSGSSGSSGTGIGSTSGSSSGVIVDARPYSCTNPASSVPPYEIPVYMGVIQHVGACSASDIAGFVIACDSIPPEANAAQCKAWFNSAPPTCLSCLGVGDGGTPASKGGLWFDWKGYLIAANFPGCVAIVDGDNQCATTFNNYDQCLWAAGCDTCTTQAEFNTCLDQVMGNGGPCFGYLQSWNKACLGEEMDGGALNNADGACRNDTQVLSIICGNGSGDGG
jgi:hypothetical protein